MGMDLRQPDFAGQWREVLNDIETLSIRPTVIFTDSSNQVLLRRYATTRRPHPLASGSLGWKGRLGVNERFWNPSAPRRIWSSTRPIIRCTTCAG
jgi:Predicted P-loop-containing kinase